MAPQGRSSTRVYKPGVGPLTEDGTLEKVLEYFKTTSSQVYQLAGPATYPGTHQKCDFVMPNEWAIEFKLVRPFGDNGIEAEHWIENLLYPYPGTVSSIGDCLKLIESNFSERKAVIVFGYEHTPPKINLECAVKAFELLATQLVCIQLGERVMSECSGLIHPYHQQAKVFGWEILRPNRK